MARSIITLLGILLMMAITVSAHSIIGKPKMHTCPRRSITKEAYDRLLDASLSLQFIFLNIDDDLLANSLNSLYFERDCLADAYYETFGKDLKTDINKYVTGELKDLLISFVTDAYEFYADEIHDGTYGFNSNAHAVIDVLCSIYPNQLPLVRKMYYSKYKSRIIPDVRKRIYAEITGQGSSTFNLSTFPRLLDLILFYQKVSSKVQCEGDGAPQIVQRLYYALKHYDYRAINRLILISAHNLKMKKVMEIYEQVYEVPLTVAVKKYTLGSYQKALLAIINSACCVGYLGNDMLEY